MKKTLRNQGVRKIFCFSVISDNIFSLLSCGGIILIGSFLRCAGRFNKVCKIYLKIQNLILSMEFEIVKFLNHLGSGWIDPATVFVSSNTLLGIVGIIITVYFFIYDKKNGKRIAVASVIAMVLHFLISEIFFKHILPEFGLFRLRPYLAYPEEIIPLGKLGIDSSFPSSHMAYTLSLLTVYVCYYRKYLPAAAAFAVFMAFARIHNGMHYPGDVLAGAILGVSYGLAGIYMVKNKKIDDLF